MLWSQHLGGDGSQPSAFFSQLQSIQYPHSAAPAMARPASCLAKGKKVK